MNYSIISLLMYPTLPFHPGSSLSITNCTLMFLLSAARSQSSSLRRISADDLLAYSSEICTLSQNSQTAFNSWQTGVIPVPPAIRPMFLRTISCASFCPFFSLICQISCLLEMEDALPVVRIFAMRAFYSDLVSNLLRLKMLAHCTTHWESFSRSVDFDNQVKGSFLVNSADWGVLPRNWLSIDGLAIGQTPGIT